MSAHGRAAEAANRNFETCIPGRAGRFPTNSGVRSEPRSEPICLGGDVSDRHRR